MLTETPTIIDGTAFIRRRPEMYGLSLPPKGWELAWRMAGDALALSSVEASVARKGEWWVIVADRDWIGPHADRDVATLFVHPTAFPEACSNSTRSEAVVTAFAAAVATRAGGGSWAGGGPWKWIKGSEADRRALKEMKLPPAARVVAFRPDPALTR